VLSNKEHRVFLDAKTLLPGALWDIEIPDAQRVSDVTVVLVSSRGEAAFYEREEIAAAIALSRKLGGEHRVVPVYLDRAADQRPDIYGLRRIHGILLDEAGSLEQIADQLVSMLQAVRRHPHQDARLDPANPKRVDDMSSNSINYGSHLPPNSFALGSKSRRQE
jgi:hypothetical protein